MSRLGLLEPRTLALLLASLRGLHNRRICDPLADFTPPRDPRAPSCLSQAALGELIAQDNGHWQRSESAVKEPMVLGNESFADSHGVDRVTAILRTALATETNWSAASIRSFGAMVFELAENVMQHADTRGGVVVLGIRPVRQTISLAIADDGIGVRESLARNYRYRDIADDWSAIRTSMDAGATSEPGTGGGMGLYLARLVVRMNEGSFMVRSGEAHREEGAVVDNAKHLPHLQGTLIAVEARTDRPLDFGQIEEMLERPSGVSD